MSPTASPSLVPSLLPTASPSVAAVASYLVTIVFELNDLELSVFSTTEDEFAQALANVFSVDRSSVSVEALARDDRRLTTGVTVVVTVEVDSAEAAAGIEQSVEDGTWRDRLASELSQQGVDISTEQISGGSVSVGRVSTTSNTEKESTTSSLQGQPSSTVSPTSMPTISPTEGGLVPISLLPQNHSVSSQLSTDSTANLQPALFGGTLPANDESQGYSAPSKVAIVDVRARFPLSDADLLGQPQIPMRLAIESGLAYAIGFNEDSVDISRVNYRPLAVSAGRRLLSYSTVLRISITCDSIDSDHIKALQENIESACASGAAVDSIQSQARKYDTLTPALEVMPSQLNVSTSVRFVIKHLAVQSNYSNSFPVLKIAPVMGLPLIVRPTRKYAHPLDNLDSYMQYYLSAIGILVFAVLALLLARRYQGRLPVKTVKSIVKTNTIQVSPRKVIREKSDDQITSPADETHKKSASSPVSPASSGGRRTSAYERRSSGPKISSQRRRSSLVQKGTGEKKEGSSADRRGSSVAVAPSENEDRRPSVVKRPSLIQKGAGEKKRNSRLRRGDGPKLSLDGQTKWQSSADAVQNASKQTALKSNTARIFKNKLSPSSVSGSQEAPQNWQASATSLKKLLRTTKRVSPQNAAARRKNQFGKGGSGNEDSNEELIKAAVVIQRKWRQKRLKVITARIIARKRALDEKLKRQQERMARQQAMRNALKVKA
jgi:hypothetical protein